jgi:hypothetical protein
MNQSLLKTLIDSPAKFIESQQIPESRLYYEEKGHFVIGGAVDCIKTRGREAYNNLYYNSEADKKPSDVVMSISKLAFDNYINLFSGGSVLSIKGLPEADKFNIFSGSDERFNDLVHKSINIHEYYMNRKKETWQEDTRLEDMRKKGLVDYCISLIKAFGKQIITANESQIIDSIVMSLATHPHTKWYFFNHSSKDIDIYRQFPIYFIYKDVECKALLDFLIIDHTSKTIIPADLKTMAGFTLRFPDSMKARRYDFQAAFYKLAVEAFVEANPQFKDYIIRPFRFIVETTDQGRQGSPLVFRMTDDLEYLAINGRRALYLSDYTDPKFAVRIKPVKGINQCIEDYKFYMDKGFSVPREILETTNGEFQMSWDELYPV